MSEDEIEARRLVEGLPSIEDKLGRRLTEHEVEILRMTLELAEAIPERPGESYGESHVRRRMASLRAILRVHIERAETRPRRD